MHTRESSNGNWSNLIGGSLTCFDTSPIVTTDPATAVTTTTATLNGKINPKGLSTLGWYRYSTINPGTCNDTFGTPTSSTNMGAGNTDVSNPLAISGLSLGTTYYYCAIGENSGGKAYGNVLSFITPLAACEIGYFDFTSPTYTADYDAFCSGYQCNVIGSGGGPYVDYACVASCWMVWPTPCNETTCTTTTPFYNIVERCPLPTVLELCQNGTRIAQASDTFSPSLIINTSVSLQAFYDNQLTPQCTGTPIDGSWTSDTASSVVYLSSGSQPKVITAGANGIETVTVSAGTDTITLNYSVSCAQDSCVSITAKTDKYCSSKTIFFNNGCNGTISCQGTRTCDFNWKEVAP
ncbi:MAG TPA: hypothetical protein VJH89_01560 [Patescibacteria group bacterium]|nr:hypothetical protein [Patescibacteria group bacterium]